MRLKGLVACGGDACDVLEVTEGEEDGVGVEVGAGVDVG